MNSMISGCLIADAAVNVDGSRAIQLALTPVFLLTAIAGLLNVMTGRLSRIIDRGRQISESPTVDIERNAQKYTAELRLLERRRRLVGMAITMVTLSALLTCLVIVLLFAEALLVWPLIWLEGLIFTAGILALVVGLSYFLQEVHVATQTMRFEVEDIPLPPTNSGGG